MQKSVFPITQTGRFLDNWSRRDFPIDIIPNNMGINLCAVESIEQIKQDDGQFVSVLINFIPEPKEKDFVSKLKNLRHRVDASKMLENKLKTAIRDFYMQIAKHSHSIDIAISLSEGLNRRIQSSFDERRNKEFHYYLLQFENRELKGDDILVTASFHKDGKKVAQFEMFNIKFFKNGFQNEVEYLKGFDFLSKYL